MSAVTCLLFSNVVSCFVPVRRSPIWHPSKNELKIDTKRVLIGADVIQYKQENELKIWSMTCTCYTAGRLYTVTCRKLGKMKEKLGKCVRFSFWMSPRFWCSAFEFLVCKCLLCVRLTTSLLPLPSMMMVLAFVHWSQRVANNDGVILSHCAHSSDQCLSRFDTNSRRQV